MPHARGSKASTKILATTTTIWPLAMMIRRSAHLWPIFAPISNGLPGRRVPSILCMHENFSRTDLKDNTAKTPYINCLGQSCFQGMRISTHMPKLWWSILSCDIFAKSWRSLSMSLGRLQVGWWTLDLGPWALDLGQWMLSQALTCQSRTA